MNSVFFQDLNRVLKQQGTGTPQLIVDHETFEQNIDWVKRQIPIHLQPRLVVKSLACIDLLKHAAHALETQRFMVFHLLHLPEILAHFPQADILLGKPMPMRAVQAFYQQYPQYHTASIQWLVDDFARLKQYRQIAEQLRLCLQLNIEIDVGLHRGGVQRHDQLTAILDEIQQSPQWLKFSGLMGYDAHVAKIPSLLQKPEKNYQQSQQQYQDYQLIIQQSYPNLWRDDLCFNGGGSPTFVYHCQQSVCNDVAFGSMLLKPSDFEVKGLEPLKCALWIATPVLKVLPYSRIPGFSLLEYVPHCDKALFVYGGYWLADYVYPEQSHPHVIYGRSSNQEMVQIPKHSQIEVDDYVFLRPKQSEAVIAQFAHLYCYQYSDQQYQHRNLSPMLTLRE